jgi:hypothetical protein
MPCVIVYVIVSTCADVYVVIKFALYCGFQTNPPGNTGDEVMMSGRHIFHLSLEL